MSKWIDLSRLKKLFSNFFPSNKANYVLKVCCNYVYM